MGRAQRWAMGMSCLRVDQGPKNQHKIGMTSISSAPALDPSEDAALLGPDPHLITHPARQQAPFVFGSPHSGRHYPKHFVENSPLDARVLRASEDFYVDELFGAAPQMGAPLLQATYARAYLDVNREPWELDPNMFDEPLPDYVNSRSGRVSAGLGTIARVVSSGTNIYSGKLRFEDARARVESIYMPYHRAQQDLLAKTLAQFGCSVLVDCHSMPSAGDWFGDKPLRPKSKMPDFILGNRYGRSCAPVVMEVAEAALSRRGYNVVRNDPYSGGFNTRRHGEPKNGQHALQIEISRALYMDEESLDRTDGFATLTRDLGELITDLLSIPVNALIPK